MPPKKKIILLEEEDVTPRLLPLYKRKCDQVSIQMLPELKELLELAGEKGKFQQFHSQENNIGPLQIRALMTTLNQLKFNKFKSLRIWKSKIGDEGVRNICRYLDGTKDNTLQMLDMLESQIGPLGCQFIGKSFTNPWIMIKQLKLDNNEIGIQGLKHLSQGLRTNGSLTNLSLKYCGITRQGSRYLQQILANLNSKIRSIKLEGNKLQNEGIFDLLRVIDINEMLDQINIADTGLNLLAFKAQHLFVLEKQEENYYGIEKHQLQQQSNNEEQIPDNPQKQEQKVEKQKDPNIKNVKQVIPVEDQRAQSPQKGGEDDDEQLEIVEPEKKLTRRIYENDKSIEAMIMRKLCQIMTSNIIISKYDIRFNPISNDAANMLFEVIEENPAIKDIEFNNNVDADLRDTMDTLMRRRTGRMPKGRAPRRKPKKKK